MTSIPLHLNIDSAPDYLIDWQCETVARLALDELETYSERIVRTRIVPLVMLDATPKLAARHESGVIEHLFSGAFGEPLETGARRKEPVTHSRAGTEFSVLHAEKVFTAPVEFEECDHDPGFEPDDSERLVSASGYEAFAIEPNEFHATVFEIVIRRAGDRGWNQWWQFCNITELYRRPNLGWHRWQALQWIERLAGAPGQGEMFEPIAS